MAKKKEVVVDETASLAFALRELCEQKGLSKDVVIDAMSEALKKAYFKFSGDYSDSIINVEINLDSGAIKMEKLRNVVEEIEDDVFETDPEEAFEETGVHYQVGDVVRTPIDVNEFRRAAAMLAKNVFKQKLREAEKAVVVEQYADKVGDIMAGIVDVVEPKHCIVKIGHTNAYLSRSSMIPGEQFKQGQTVMVYVEEVVKNATGTPIMISRVNPKFVTRLMEKDINEVYDGTVEIKGIARTAGVRSKVAVFSKDPNVDPSGACIGIHGARISRVLSQINGEKIDVVNFNENPLLFVADALKPAQVVGMQMLDEENKACRAIVADDQYSLAIGKEATNVNLAVRLTGWKIDIKSVSDAMAEGYEYQTLEEIKFMDLAKRQKAVKQTAASKVVVSDTPVEKVATPVTADVVSPSVEATKEEVVSPVEEVIVPKKTKAAKNPNAFADLEAALSQAAPVEQAPAKKKWTKKKTTDEEEVVETKEEVKEKPVVPQNVLPVYTEEELRAMDEEEENENEKYDEDIDFDEFDDYYDEK